ncbi:pheromone processing endoprotease [Dinochytrium kinnereticum]|nr:pheromone processing endoprotease [Dinochytrium kinnereticum]
MQSAGPWRASSLADHGDIDFEDPGFARQWHLVNRVNAGHDLNVLPVWKMGITGAGVVVAVVDDGLDFRHPDLASRFCPEGSYDFNTRQPLPLPRLPTDRHGTRCAGQIAAAPNNECGVGVAWGSRVSGIRLLSTNVTELEEAKALNYAYQLNDIYSCSWGPKDDGTTLYKPPPVVQKALLDGITNGRRGKGSIFVFASGNGGDYGDDCNFDGLANSIYTVTIGAIDRNDQHPSYSEKCTSILAVTYSSSGNGDGLHTTDIDGQCTNKHRKTSAATPLAAGLMALALEIRPDLTWRDIQHLIVRSAIPFSLNDLSWQKVASARVYSRKFGFGKLDAEKLILNAMAFQTVRNMTTFLSPVNIVDKIIPYEPALENSKSSIRSLLMSSIRVNTWEVDEIGTLEHVAVTVDISHMRRGDLEIWLISPHGYRSLLAPPRIRDTSSNGFRNYTFTSILHWGENPVGNWTLTVRDVANPQDIGQLHSWQLSLYGEIRGPEPVIFHEESPKIYNQTTSEVILKASILIAFLLVLFFGRSRFSFAKSSGIPRNYILKRTKT